MNLTNTELPGPQNPAQYFNFQFLDRGGFGEVYSATDRVTNTPVAIKFVPITTPEEFTLLQHEAQLARALTHDKIVTTYYFSQINLVEGEFAYTVMEFVARSGLHKLLSQLQDPMSVEQCIKYMMDVCEALAYAHETIVHRDLKPRNLLISDNDHLKICDFGLSKRVYDATRSNTLKGWGTASYMAPEAWTGQKNTPAMDFYSVGIIAYEMLTGKLPFTGSSEIELRDHHLFSPMPSIASTRNDVPLLLTEIIGKLTQKRAADRYASASDILHALRSVPQSSNSTYDSLAQMAAHKKNKIDESRLAEELKISQEEAKRKLSHFAIGNLATQLSHIVKQVNQNLENEKVNGNLEVDERAKPHEIKLIIDYFDKEIVTGFFPIRRVEKHITDFKANSLEYQKKSYGMVMMTPEPSYFESDMVQVAGYMYVTNTTQPPYGFNLLLRKTDPNDIYGEWWVCLFSEHVLSKKSELVSDFAFTDIIKFFKEFEICRQTGTHVYKIKYEKLDEHHITSLFKKLLT